MEAVPYRSFARAYMAQKSSWTSASIRTISRDTIKTMPIPLPPLAEQKRIVAKVDALMSLCDELERRARGQEEIRVRAAQAAVGAMTGAGDGAR